MQPNSETRKQDPTSTIALRIPYTISFSRLSLSLFGDQIFSVRHEAGVEIVLSMLAKNALLGWIPLNSSIE